MIKKENNKYVVYSESGRKFGEYKTLFEAKKRLMQMEYFKRLKKEAGFKIDKKLLFNIHKKVKNSIKDSENFDKFLTTILVIAHAQGPEIEIWKQGIKSTLSKVKNSAELSKIILKNPKIFKNVLTSEAKKIIAKQKLLSKNRKAANAEINVPKDVKDMMMQMKYKKGVNI